MTTVAQTQTVSVAPSLIYRSDYSSDHPIPPAATEYTGTTLQIAYFIFIVLLFIQALIIVIIKTQMSMKFRKASCGSKLQHVIECLSLPESFNNWDDAEGSVEDLRKQRKKVFKEILATSALHLISNMLMLIPLLYAGKTLKDNSSANPSILPGFRIQERHNIIVPVIGAFPEEKAAFSLVQVLVWAAPVTVVAAALGDLFLSWAYLWFFHPWRDILAKVGHGRGGNHGQEVTQEPELTDQEAGHEDLEEAAEQEQEVSTRAVPDSTDSPHHSPSQH